MRKIYSHPRVSSIFPCVLLCPPIVAAVVIQRVHKIESTEANPARFNPEPPRQLQGRFLHITDMHPDPLYRPGAALSTACHRNRPKKEPERAGYLGTPYEFVIFPRVYYRFRKPRSETSGSAAWGPDADFNPYFPSSQGLRLASFVDELHLGLSGGALGERY